MNNILQEWIKSGYCRLSSDRLSKKRLEELLKDNYWDMMNYTTVEISVIMIITFWPIAWFFGTINKFAKFIYMIIIFLNTWPIAWFFGTINKFKRFVSKVFVGRLKRLIDNMANIKDIIE